MRIDSHQHFWKYNDLDFGWISKRMSLLKRDFLPGDLKIELPGIKFDGSIAVQARQSLAETEFLLHLSEENDFIKGVVGWVDLKGSDLETQLTRFCKHTKFKGVRHVIHDEPDDKFILNESFKSGISLLKKYQLTYDILVFPKHLTCVLQLVGEFPDQNFVIDHLAKPDIKNNRMRDWQSNIIKIAKHPNVMCKLSGMVTEAVWNEWNEHEFAPYLDTVFETFGEDRLMIGSDWPVCLIAARDYKQVMDVVMNYIKKKGKETENKVLGLNAVQFYKL
jgi:L-fuconolactonase